MLTIRYFYRFKKDYKAIKKRGYDTRLLEEVLDILSAERPLLPKHYRNAQRFIWLINSPSVHSSASLNFMCV